AVWLAGVLPPAVDAVEGEPVHVLVVLRGAEGALQLVLRRLTDAALDLDRSLGLEPETHRVVGRRRAHLPVLADSVRRVVLVGDSGPGLRHPGSVVGVGAAHPADEPALHRSAAGARAGDVLGVREEQGLGHVVAAPVAGLPTVVGLEPRRIAVGDATEAVAFIGGGPELAIGDRVLGGGDDLPGGVEHRVADERLATGQRSGGAFDRLAGLVAVGGRGGSAGWDEKRQARQGGDGRDEEGTTGHGGTSERSLGTGGPSGAATFETPLDQDDDAQTGRFPQSGRVATRSANQPTSGRRADGLLDAA